MKKEWQQLEIWLASNQPGSLLDLNPPASDSDIQALEETIGIHLPADFIATLKIHNGQKGQARGILMLPLLCGVLSSLLTRPFYAVPRTSVSRIA